jgi:NAD(P)-dependent dehydrogenase (short-subunit alcohol dehydrogenase family)
MLDIFKKKTHKRLHGKIALITGASRGIGAAVAEGFAGEGAHVILLARTVGGLEEIDDRIQAAGGRATLLPFDLGDIKKIPALAAAIQQKFGKLDILVGNAAMLGNLSPVALSDPKVFEETFRINFFANYHLIRTLDPLLRVSGAGRAVFVTSGAAQSSAPFWAAYAASKSALERMVAAYAAESAHSGIKANIIDPGVIRTEMRAEAFPAEDASLLPPPESVVERFIELSLDTCAASGQIIRAAA